MPIEPVASSTPASSPDLSLALSLDREFIVEEASVGLRLDHFLVRCWPDVSRSRVQQWIDRGFVSVDGESLKASWRLRLGERVRVVGDPTPEPIRAEPENIPLDIIFEDAHFAVVHKPAGMMVHAGSGATVEASSHGTLVNALLHYYGPQGALSSVSGPVRPGIVHRLDKQTSGLIIVAKNDRAHRLLGAMFAERRIEKTYIALVHGHVTRDTETINAPITRDRVHRIRMTTRVMTRGSAGRTAISHYTVQERITGPFGKFSLLRVRIETGRTHQIRVHLSSIGHPVVGDHLYGAQQTIAPLSTAPKLPGRAATPRTKRVVVPAKDSFSLDRNFLHAAELKLKHPETGAPMEFNAPLPPALTAALVRLGGAMPKPAAPIDVESPAKTKTKAKTPAKTKAKTKAKPKAKTKAKAKPAKAAPKKLSAKKSAASKPKVAKKASKPKSKPAKPRRSAAKGK